MYGDMYILDGKGSGIVAIKPGTDEIIKMGKFKEYSSFCNKNLLETELYRSDVMDYELGFMLDGKLIPYSKAQQIQYDLYQAVVDGELVDIVPTFKEKIYKCGYFSFTEDYITRMNYKEGREINKKLYSAVKNTAAYLLRNGVFKSSGIDASLCSIAPNIGPMKYEIFTDTTTLRIMRGFELVKINENRKIMNKNVLPFNSDKDKYKNIYFCFSRDENEFKGDKKYHEVAEDIIGSMIEYLERNYEELIPVVNMVNFYHPIQL